MIDVDELKSHAKDVILQNGAKHRCIDATIISELPKQEIVRCKDCKWWDKKNDSNYGYCHACKHGYSSPHWEIGIYRTYDGEWFCADGEKR